MLICDEAWKSQTRGWHSSRSPTRAWRPCGRAPPPTESPCGARGWCLETQGRLDWLRSRQNSVCGGCCIKDWLVTRVGRRATDGSAFSMSQSEPRVSGMREFTGAWQMEPSRPLAVQAGDVVPTETDERLHWRGP